MASGSGHEGSCAQAPVQTAATKRPKIRLGPISFMVIGAVLVLAGTLVIGLVTIPRWSTTASEMMAANMVPPDDMELPATTFTPPASLLEDAAIVGRGEGLDCSIPQFLEDHAFPHGKGAATVSLLYRQACVAHDYCYRHGAATYGYTQADCDGALARAAMRICVNYVAKGKANHHCVQRARKVYAGLLAGGAGSFRPNQPDFGWYENPDEKNRKPADCHGNEQVTHAFAKWPEALKNRLAGMSDCVFTTAMTGHYDELGQAALDRLLQAWLDVASSVGEYDPYPLAEAMTALPRLETGPDGKGRLVFYLQRAGGARLSEYYFHSRPDGALALCPRQGCGLKAKPVPVNTGYEYRPSAPWVTIPNSDDRGLVWWKRNSTGRSSTGGTLAGIVLEVPKQEDLRNEWHQKLLYHDRDLLSPSVFPVKEDGRIARLVGIYDDRSANDAGKRSRFRFGQWRVSYPNGDLGKHGVRAEVQSIDELGDSNILSTLSIPPMVMSQSGRTSVTLFSRSGIDYKSVLTATAWQVQDRPAAPVAASKTKKSKGEGELIVPGAAKQTGAWSYAISEAKEPFAALSTGGGAPMLFSINCEPPPAPEIWTAIARWLHFSAAPDRCNSKSLQTIVNLTRDFRTTQLHSKALLGRYISRVPIFRYKGLYRATLVRFSIHKLPCENGDTSCDRSELLAFVRVVTMSPDDLAIGPETSLGSVSPTGGEKIVSALQRATRLVPIVGGIDRPGTPDLILATSEIGSDSLAFRGSDQKTSLAFSRSEPASGHPISR